MSNKEERVASPAFKFKVGDLVLVKWEDGMVYFAKIKKIDEKRSKCVVIFDDKSQDDADFAQIHSVDETTTDIICIKCKRDESDYPNEIVLCDKCGIGFHQRCHNPSIPASALQLDTPWNCVYCQKGTKCPYLTDSLNAYQTLISGREDDDEGEQYHDTGKGEEGEEVESTTPSAPAAMDFTEEGGSSKFSSIKKKMQGKKSDRGKGKFKGERGRLGSKEAKSLTLDLVKTRKTSLSSEDASSMSAHTEFQVDTTPGNPSPADGPSRKKKRGGGSHGGGGVHKRPKITSVEAVTVTVTSVPTHLAHQDEEETRPCTSGEVRCNPSGSEVASVTPVPSSEQDVQSSLRSTRLGSVATTAAGKQGTEPSMLPSSTPAALSAPAALFPTPVTLEKPRGGSESFSTWEKFVREGTDVVPIPTTTATVVLVASPLVDCSMDEAGGSNNSPPDSPKLVIASPDPTSPPATQDIFVFPEYTDTVAFSAVSLAQIKPMNANGPQPSNLSQAERQQSEKKSSSVSSLEKQKVEEKHSSLGEQQIENKSSGIPLQELQQAENKQGGLNLPEKQHSEANQLPNANISEKVKMLSEPKHCSFTIPERPQPETKHCGVTLPERPTSLFNTAVAVAMKPSQTEQQVNKQTVKPTNMADAAVSGGEVMATVTISSPAAAATLGLVRVEARTPASRLIPADPGLGTMGQKTSVISLCAKSNGACSPLPLPSSSTSSSLVMVATSTFVSSAPMVQSVSSSAPMQALSLGSAPTVTVGTTGGPPLMSPVSAPPPTPRESPLLAMMASRSAAAAAESNSYTHPLSAAQGPKSLSATPSPLLSSPSLHRLPRDSDDVIITGESKKKSADSRKGLHSEMEHPKVSSSARALQGGDALHLSADAPHNHHHYHHYRGASTQPHPVTKAIVMEKQHGVGWEVQQDNRPSISSPLLRHVVPSTGSVAPPTVATQFIPISYITTDPTQLGFSMQQQQQQQDRTLQGHLITKSSHPSGKYKSEMIPGPISQSPLLCQPHHSTLSPGLTSVATPLTAESTTYITSHTHQQGYPNPSQMFMAGKEKCSPPPYSSFQHSHLHSPIVSTTVAQTQFPVVGSSSKQQVYLASMKQQQTPLTPASYIPLGATPYPSTLSKDHYIVVSNPVPTMLPAYIPVPSDVVHNKQPGLTTSPFMQVASPQTIGASAQVQGLCSPSVLPPSYLPKELVPSSQPQDSAGQVIFTNSRPHMSVSPCPPGGHASSPSSSWHQQMGEMSDPATVAGSKPFAVVSAQQSKGPPSDKVSPTSCEVNEKGTSPIYAPALPLPGSSKAQQTHRLANGGDGSTHHLSPRKSEKANHASTKCSTSTTSAVPTTGSGGQVGGRGERRPDDALKAITKSIQDAFVESNEKKLMAAFEDAWKKFQANGKRYEHVAQQVRKQGSSTISEETHKGSKAKLAPKSGQHPQNSSPIVQPAVSAGQPGPVPAAPTGAVQQAAGTGHHNPSHHPYHHHHPATTPSAGLVGLSATSTGLVGTPAAFISSPSPYYVVYASQPPSHMHIAMPQTPPDLQTQQQKKQQQPVFVQQQQPVFVQQQQPVFVQQQQQQQQPVSCSEYALYATVPHSQAKTLVQTAGVYFPSSLSPAHMSGVSGMQHSQRVSNPVPISPTDQLISVHNPSPVSVPVPTKQASIPNQVFGQRMKPRLSSAPLQKSKSKSVRICSRCGNEATYLCSGCQQEWYCGRDCQLKSWDSHSENCKA